MPRPNIIVGLYPDVPAFRGVPQLVRSPTAIQIRALAIATAAIRGRLWRSVQSQPKWGIFNSLTNELAIEPDSVLAFENRTEYRVADFPVQAGAFASYNKVAQPFELTIRLSKSGTLEGRARFLQQIATALASLDLFYVLTPERSYFNVNLVRSEITRRGSAGAFFLTEVDIFFREIRIVAAQYSTTSAATRDAKEPSAQPSVSQGVVQPAPLPDSLNTDGF